MRFVVEISSIKLEEMLKKHCCACVSFIKINDLSKQWMNIKYISVCDTKKCITFLRLLLVVLHTTPLNNVY